MIARVLARTGLLVVLVACAPATATLSVSFVPGQLEKGAFGSVKAGTPTVSSLTASRSAHGRDCLDVTFDLDTQELRFTHAVDASSDWGGLRLLATVLPDTLQAIVGTAVLALVRPVTLPLELIASLAGIGEAPPPQMAPPSAISACSAFYEAG